MLKKILKKIIKKTLSYFGFILIKETIINDLRSNKNIAEEYKFILEFPIDNSYNFLRFKDLSTSQLKQDLFVLSQLDFKKRGFFIEFGATNGISMSNTYLLEKKFKWDGILAEPARCWHKELEKNRNVSIEKKCVWIATGERLSFNQADMASLSTIDGFGKDDSHVNSRKFGKNYFVETISLIDLLKKYDAPKIVDYLSIDTEGSEFMILNNFDFEQYKFEIITVEHNYTEERGKILELLNSKGYRRVFENYSLFDDWYVLNK